jgi:hypothetical protein
MYNFGSSLKTKNTIIRTFDLVPKSVPTVQLLALDQKFLN